ncbi:MAG: septum formation family protein [Acidimicrobiia bacterium]|nr:septum formation family protein [Acidimicrobiia bacterium]
MTAPVVPLPTRVAPGSAGGAGRLAQATLFGFIGVELVSLLTGIVTLLRWEQRQVELNSEEAFFADGWDFGVGFAYFGVFIICGIAWLIWQYQAHSNLSSMTATKYRPAAAFWILVPIASLFVPFLAIGELARAGIDRPILRRWWWGLYLAMNALVGVSSVAGLAEMWLTSLIVGIAASAVGIGAAICAIRLISLINSGLESRRASAGRPAGRPTLTERAGLFWAGGASLLTVMGGSLFGVALPEIVRNLPAVPETNLAFVVGACFSETEVDFIDVSCNGPHEAEVYEVLEYPEASAYPGDDLIADWAEPQCYAQFEPYTGVPYPDSALEFGYLFPSAQGWQVGDREVICYLFDPSGDDLTEPVAQAA